LRAASVFVILACATTGTLFPVLAKKSTWLHVPKSVFEFAKYFGSGVIIATAFIHLLAPGLEELGSDCLSPAWQEYPYALALCLLSIMSIFILEVIAFRWGTARLQRLNIDHDAHAAYGPEGAPTESPPAKYLEDAEEQEMDLSSMDDSAVAQIIGVAILEFGVILH
ncbi:ZIP zinc transporter-domain-containing protein, partial [Mycena vulgaris]